MQTISATNSWALVKEYERLIDQYGLKEIIRNPMLLMMSIAVLRDKIIGDRTANLIQMEEVEEMKVLSSKNQATKFSSYKVYDLFINNLIESSLQNAVILQNVQSEEQKEEARLRISSQIYEAKTQKCCTQFGWLLFLSTE